MTDLVRKFRKSTGVRLRLTAENRLSVDNMPIAKGTSGGTMHDLKIAAAHTAHGVSRANHQPFVAVHHEKVSGGTSVDKRVFEAPHELGQLFLVWLWQHEDASIAVVTKHGHGESVSSPRLPSCG